MLTASISHAENIKITTLCFKQYYKELTLIIPILLELHNFNIDTVNFS